MGASLLGFRGVHALLDVRRKTVECFLDVDVVLGGNFEEGDAQFVGKLLALLGGNRPLLLPVTFISNENLVYAFTRMLFNVRKPGADV